MATHIAFLCDRQSSTYCPTSPTFPPLTSQIPLDPLLTSHFPFTNLVNEGIGLGINCSCPTAALASSLTNQDHETLGFGRPEFILASLHRSLHRWHLITSIVYKQVGIIPKLNIVTMSITMTLASVRTRTTPPNRDREVVNTATSGAVANEDSPTTNITLETFKDHQSNVLPHKKLMIVFPAIALAQMISYMDQTSVSTAVPAIGSGLNLGPSISWVAASFLIASTSIQLVNGRLSDIFGRKPLLLTCLGLLAFGNLVAGFSTTPAMLFAFRALSGLGGGAMYEPILPVHTLIRRGE